MLEPGGEMDLAEKALGAHRDGELGVEHLDRDRPVVLEVAGEPDGGHAPAAELALEGVAVLQTFAQQRRVGHGARWVGEVCKIPVIHGLDQIRPNPARRLPVSLTA